MNPLRPRIRKHAGRWVMTLGDSAWGFPSWDHALACGNHLVRAFHVAGFNSD